ncbi:MAG: zf-HC2 domain-containing protein [Candidatus Goldbacteria bacterium]|nr:zf-HC2 domain-containing protein [Candidatus Goldiibacteriota bacterium]
MDCNYVIDNLYDFLNNEIDEDAKKFIENHLHSCEICKKEREVLVAVKSRLKDAMQCPPPELLQKIKKSTKTNSWLNYILQHKKALAFSATFVLIILGMLLFSITFNKNQNSIDEFLYDIYNINIEENYSNNLLTILNND